MSVYFFATRSDILPILEEIEKKIPIKYTVAGGFSVTVPLDTFFTSAEDGRVGIPKYPNGLASWGFLITKAESQVALSFMQTIYGPRYFVDQLLNPESQTLTPGGTWANDIVLEGRIASVLKTPFSSKVERLFRRLASTKFEKIKAFYVGREAAEILDAGGRLTSAVNANPDYDLRR